MGIMRLWRHLCMALALGGLAFAARSAPPPGEVSLTEGIPQSRIIGDPGAPYENLFRDLRFAPELRPKIGPVETRLPVVQITGQTGVGVPFIDRGFRPEDAELKIGNFYFDVRALSASLLYSDNARQQEANRENALIGIARLDLAALYQVTEGLRVAVAGALIYLPFQNKTGIDGFGLRDPAMAQFGLAGDFMRAQAAYDFRLAGWDVEMVDDFVVRVSNPRLRGFYQQQFELFEPQVFTGVDQAGRYRFGGSRVPRDFDRSEFEVREPFEIAGAELRNLIGATASRMVPTETFVRLSVHRSESWFLGGNTLRLPRTAEGASVLLESRRENLRFKPYLRYSVSRISTQEKEDHQALAGVRGPITDQLDFLAEAGYGLVGDRRSERALWRIAFDHTPTPLTSHSIEYRQSITEPEPNRAVEESLSYQIQQVLGSYLVGGAFTQWFRQEDVDNPSGSSEGLRSGVRLRFEIGPRTSLTGTGLYWHTEFDASGAGDSDRWTAQLAMVRQFSDKLSGRLLYRYEQRDSTRANDSYYENLAVLTLTRTF